MAVLQGTLGVKAEKEKDSTKNGKEEPWPVAPEPHAPPPLPRHLLACREKELRMRLEELQKKPGDPRIGLAEQHLRDARSMLREAGGPSERRLAFSMLDANDRVRKAEEQLQSDKAELLRVNEQVRQALELQERVEAKIRASEQQLDNAQAKHAHLGFQIAIEAGGRVEGYEELAAALSMVEAHVAAGGNGRLGKAQERVSQFVRMFEKQEYDRGADPVLQEVASVGSQGSNATVLVERWEDSEVEGDKRAVGEEEAQEGTKKEVSGDSAGQCLKKVCVAAANACVRIQLLDARQQQAQAVNIASFGVAQVGVASAGVGLPQSTQAGQSMALVALQAGGGEDMPGARKRGRSLDAGSAGFQFGIRQSLWAGGPQQLQGLALCRWNPLVGSTRRGREATVVHQGLREARVQSRAAIADRSRTPEK